jgi:peptidoglycan/xylan/chitin deacetylase (PgdA/CDA1 family)
MMCETVCKSDEKNGANRGVVCFTFDDYHGENWLKADSLFRKYDAHVTFFIMGDISPERAEVMKKLKASGHTIGLHSVHHSHVVNFIRENGERRYLEEEIRPQLDTCREYGFDVRSFSYPCNYRNEESDQVLFRYFDYLRTGRGLDNIPTPYYPLNELPEKCCFTGIGVGTFYGTELPVLKEEMTHAAETGSILVLYAHNIGPLEEIKKNDMPVEWLEELLAFAKASGIRIAGFDELNSLKR